MRAAIILLLEDYIKRCGTHGLTDTDDYRVACERLKRLKEELHDGQ